MITSMTYTMNLNGAQEGAQVKSVLYKGPGSHDYQTMEKGGNSRYAQRVGRAEVAASLDLPPESQLSDMTNKLGDGSRAGLDQHRLATSDGSQGKIQELKDPKVDSENQSGAPDELARPSRAGPRAASGADISLTIRVDHVLHPAAHFSNEAEPRSEIGRRMSEAATRKSYQGPVSGLRLAKRALAASQKDQRHASHANCHVSRPCTLLLQPTQS